MSTHLVRHRVSEAVVELTDVQLATPLGDLYDPVKINENGKRYVSLDGKPVLIDAPTKEEVAAEKSEVKPSTSKDDK